MLVLKLWLLNKSSRLKYEKNSESVTVMFYAVFFKSTMFYGTFNSMNNFICQNKALQIANKIAPKWKIVLKQGEKFDYPVDPVKSVKTGRLPLASGDLTGLLSFLSFLKMEQYYKRLFRVGKKTWKLKTVPTIKLPIKSHQQNRKQKKGTHKYCSSCCSTITT